MFKFAKRGVTFSQNFRPFTTASSAVKNSSTVSNSFFPHGSSSLEEADAEVAEILQQEKSRQLCSIELIASENYASKPVLECLGSHFNNKYAEGYPGRRYYAGNVNSDKVELLCQKRALETFRLDPNEWGVNVQAYSGSPANWAVYNAVLKPHDRIMGLDLPAGGHLTHGFMTDKKRISATSVYFESMPYTIGQDGLIDYDGMEKLALVFKPKLIIAGSTAYSRHLNYQRYRDIADQIGAIVHADMAHISGLVAAGIGPSPFEHADIVTTTTHKTLRGARGALIFYRKGEYMRGKKVFNFNDDINQSVFPSVQGGPHMNAIAGICTSLKQANSQEFREYQKQVVNNSAHLANALIGKGYHVMTGGTDNHQFLVDLKPQKIDGSRVEFLLEAVNIILNKNTVLGDKSALNPGGIRIGVPGITSRGYVCSDIDQVAEFIHQGIQLACKIKQNISGKKIVDFRKAVIEDSSYRNEITTLKSNVEDFSSRFYLPG